MRVVNEAHGLSADGLRYFGLLEVANCQQTEDYAYVLGLRNSHDKRFPAGLAVGASVFVCDNLSFSGEIKIGRKHTRHLDRDLPRMVSSAVGQLADRWHEQSRRIAAYRSHEIGDKQVHDLILRALDARAITLTQIPRILTEWRAPRHVEFRVDGKTAWRLLQRRHRSRQGQRAVEPAGAHPGAPRPARHGSRPVRPQLKTTTPPQTKKSPRVLKPRGGPDLQHYPCR